MGVLSPPDRSRRSEEQPTEANSDRSTGARLVRAVLITAAVAAVVYTVVRRLRGDDGLTIEEIPGREADEVSEISIEDSVDSTGQEWDVVEEETTDEGGDGSGERSVEERSSEELAERATGDVDEESPEPGEMAVDEDVVDELVDEDDTDDDENGTAVESDGTDDEGA